MGERFCAVLCCAGLWLQLCTVCTGSRNEALVGFVAKNYPKCWMTCKLTCLVLSFLFYGGESLCCASRVFDSGSLQCAPVAEVRHLLDDLPVNLFSTELPFSWAGEDILCCSARVCNSGSVQCASVAEVRCLLDLSQKNYPKWWVTWK